MVPIGTPTPKFHAFLKRGVIHLGTFQANTLISMYSKFGSIEHAQHVFDKMPERNEASWNNLMSGFVRVGWYQKAMQFFCHMLEHGVRPSSYVAASLVTACDRSGCMTEGAFQVHAHVIKCGLACDVFVGTSLLHFYGTFGWVAEVDMVFKEIEEPNIVSWTSLMVGYAYNGCVKEVMSVYRRLRRDGVYCNENAMATVIRSCGVLVDKMLGYQVLGSVIKSGLDTTVSVANSLISMFGNCDSIEEASCVFDDMKERDTISWNSIITASVHNGHCEKSLEYFSQMRYTHAKTDYITISALLPVCGSAQNLRWGRGLHGMVVKSGLESNVCVCNSLLSMYSQAGKSEDAEFVFHKMRERDLISWNSMMASHVDNGNYPRALELLIEMLQTRKATNYIVHAFVILLGLHHNLIIGNALVTMYGKFDEVTWNALIGGHADNKEPNAAIEAFNLLREEGVPVNYITIVNLLTHAIIGNLTLLDEGQQLHSLIIKHGFESNDYVLNATMDMYGKCGEIDDVFRILPQPRSRSQRSWNILISALARHGFFQQAREAFHEMLDLGLRPDHVTFVSLLSACSHGGLVDEGLAYFSSMSTKFGVPTGIEHCVCIIDLLGRAGKLTEAENFINKMPVPPTDLVWRSLLAACKIHGNLELARKAADRLFELDSSDDSAYVLYSNVCASTRRWRDVENVRKQMESHNIKKKPACSWVKLKNQVTTFGMGDQYHPQNAEIYAKLEELKKIIREAGYMPDTSYSLQDTDEEQKEHNLWNHSERIALAFGLINSSEGSPLRIFKNLRVCGDCHSVFKMVSQIIGRKIILRDAYRFHHFSSGKCSCSDYW
uniref:DYW domain-containing protein n=1 Tax=Glycine max TaxID=3847 RepID=A0A0R0H5B5_SOYBN